MRVGKPSIHWCKNNFSFGVECRRKEMCVDNEIASSRLLMLERALTTTWAYLGGHQRTLLSRLFILNRAYS
jgi:hypothetical protein